MLPGVEGRLDVLRLRRDGKSDDDGGDVGAQEQVVVGARGAEVVGVDVDVAAGFGGEDERGGGGARVDRLEAQEGAGLDGGLRGSGACWEMEGVT